MRELLLFVVFVSMSLSTNLSAQNYDRYLKTANKHLEEGNSEKAERMYEIYKRASGKTDVSFEQALNAAKNSLSDADYVVSPVSIETNQKKNDLKTPEVKAVGTVKEEYRKQAIDDKRIVTKELAEFFNSLDIVKIHSLDEYIYIETKSPVNSTKHQEYGIILGDSKWGYKGLSNGKILEGNLPTHAGFRKVIDGKSGKYGYTDKDWDLVIPCKYEVAGHFSDDGLAAVADRDLLGYIKNLRYIDKNGVVIIKGFDVTYHATLEEQYFSSGYAVVCKHSKKYKDGFAYLIIDTSGRIVAELDTTDYFPHFYPVHDGLILARDRMTRECIYYNLKGEIVLKNLEEAYPFSCGLAKTKNGYINKQGEIVIPEVYFGTSFYYGVAMVKRTKDSVREIINTYGEKVFDINLPNDSYWCGFGESGYIYYYNYDLGRWGLVDTLGNSTFDYL